MAPSLYLAVSVVDENSFSEKHRMLYAYPVVIDVDTGQPRRLPQGVQFSGVQLTHQMHQGAEHFYGSSVVWCQDRMTLAECRQAATDLALIARRDKQLGQRFGSEDTADEIVRLGYALKVRGWGYFSLRNCFNEVGVSGLTSYIHAQEEEWRDQYARQ